MLSSTAVGLARDTDFLNAAWFRSPTWLDDLASIAQPEDWDDDDSGRQPILFNYLRYTFRRQLEQGNWREVESAGGTGSALNTGLLSRILQPIYAVFEPNRYPDRQPWVLTEWADPSSPRLKDFDLGELRPAEYFSDPGEAAFDPRLSVVANIEQLAHVNVDQYPQEMHENEHLRMALLERAIKIAASNAQRNWRTAAPQYYWPKGSAEPGRLQLLLPLSLLGPNQVDLALVLDRDPPYGVKAESDDPSGSACYRAYAVLPIGWAYRNARLITRPESWWLDPNTPRVVGRSDFDDDGRGTWRQTRGNNLCPICGSADGCLIESDNRRARCRTISVATEIRLSRLDQFWSHTAHWREIPEAALGADRGSTATNVEESGDAGIMTQAVLADDEELTF